MDISKQYIKMCAEAQEIQSSKDELIDGDFIFDNTGEGPAYVFNLYSSRGIDCKGDYETYIPRQDQLQEMMIGTPIEKLQRFGKFIFPSPPILTIKSNLSKEKIKKFKEEWGKIKNVPIVSTHYEKVEFVEIAESHFKSIEQMWLVFVMKEQHNKIWNFETNIWEETKNENTRV